MVEVDHSQLWDCQVRADLITSTLVSSVQHFKPFLILVKAKSVLLSGNVSVDGGGNLSCSPACACPADQIHPFSPGGKCSQLVFS